MSTEATARDDRRFRRAAQGAVAFVVLLWAVHTVGWITGLPVERLGVLPRSEAGLTGVLTAPLVHGSWGHLVANSLPIIVLGTALVYGFPRAARIAIPLIWLGTGIGVWLFARDSWHIGASGLTHGMMFFVFVAGILRRDRRSIALALIVFFLYGGMIWTIFPRDPDVSFESHFFGAVTGVVLAFLLRRRDPLPEPKRYDWEGEDAGAEDDPDAAAPRREP